MHESIIVVDCLHERVCVWGCKLRGGCGGPAQTAAVVAGLADRRQASRTLTSRDRSVAAAADRRTRALASRVTETAEREH